jgi:hypothetical protein
VTLPLPSRFPIKRILSSGRIANPGEKLKFEKITLSSVPPQVLKGVLHVMVIAWADPGNNAGASSKGKSNLAAERIGNEFTFDLLYNFCTQKLIPPLSVDLMTLPKDSLAVASWHGPSNPAP